MKAHGKRYFTSDPPPENSHRVSPTNIGSCSVTVLYDTAKYPVFPDSYVVRTEVNLLAELEPRSAGDGFTHGGAQ